MDLKGAVDLGAFEDSVAVAAGGDSQGAIGFIAAVEMESDGQQLFENCTWRSGVVDAVFGGG